MAVLESASEPGRVHRLDWRDHHRRAEAAGQLSPGTDFGQWGGVIVERASLAAGAGFADAQMTLILRTCYAICTAARKGLAQSQKCLTKNNFPTCHSRPGGPRTKTGEDRKKTRKRRGKACETGTCGLGYPAPPVAVSKRGTPFGRLLEDLGDLSFEGGCHGEETAKSRLHCV